MCLPPNLDVREDVQRSDAQDSTKPDREDPGRVAEDEGLGAIPVHRKCERWRWDSDIQNIVVSTKSRQAWRTISINKVTLAGRLGQT